jgi:RES domain
MLRSPTSGTFEKHLTRVSVATSNIWRLSKYPATEPWWARDACHRFDDANRVFGVLYVAQDPETAFAESIIHDNSLFANGTYQVAKAALLGRSLVGFRHPSKATLTLIDLAGVALKKLGLNNDISASNDYTIPQNWSSALHAACPDADGIRYCSRQNNMDFCYAIFERSGLICDSATPVPSSLVAQLCDAFNVTPV